MWRRCVRTKLGNAKKETADLTDKALQRPLDFSLCGWGTCRILSGEGGKMKFRRKYVV